MKILKEEEIQQEEVEAPEGTTIKPSRTTLPAQCILQAPTNGGNAFRTQEIEPSEVVVMAEEEVEAVAVVEEEIAMEAIVNTTIRMNEKITQKTT